MQTWNLARTNMKKIGFLIATLSALAAVFAFTTVQAWKIKDTYSIQFSNSDVNGIFKKASGNIAFDEADLAGSKLSFNIEVSSINTGNGLQNKHAKGPEWFDAVKYPYIKYTSSKIEKSGNLYKVTGQLEMKGVKKDISFPFSFKKNGNSATFSADFSINKNDYNVGKKGDNVGEIIQIKLSVPVTK
jgi:polyisoprenoid-binding protein YceI